MTNVLNVADYEDELSEVEMMMLRDHIGKCYVLAEKLEWCNPERHIQLQKRTVSDANSQTRNAHPAEALVPVVAVEFDTSENARQGLSELKSHAAEQNLSIYDFHYSKASNSLAVALEPFELPNRL